jgi:cyclophilin family peptidyl-prolyl cis-trans isomerase
MRRSWILLLLLAPAPALAQTRADSALVGRILAAEDRRDSADAALAAGVRHDDARVRLIARRALWRIRDPLFAARDSLPPVAAPPTWPEPAWRPRYRALADKREDCGALRAALGDAVWQVRLRAADLLPPACGGDSTIVRVLTRWVDELPRNPNRRAGGVSWHAGAHAQVALARIAPAQARARMVRLAAHKDWHVRMYAARAAALLADTQRLYTLAGDEDANVREVVIDALSRLVGHRADDVYRRTLWQGAPQAVRAAAIALKGSPSPRARTALNDVFEQWVLRASESERDVRLALLEAAGRPASDDRPPAVRPELPPEAVALALGREVRIRVTMAPTSGGGRSFVVRLRGDVAPIMAARMLALVRDHYYVDSNWHRVEPDFVIQGGGPGTNEYVGHCEYLRDELGTIAHPRGTVGMSTRGHDTGDAQWFINLKDNPRLMRDYTVFAEVVEGMDVVDGIMEGDHFFIREDRGRR